MIAKLKLCCKNLFSLKWLNEIKNNKEALYVHFMVVHLMPDTQMKIGVCAIIIN